MACAPSRVALVVRDGRFCRSPDVREARYRSSHAPPPRHAHPCRSERCGNSALDAWYTDAPREPVPGKLQPPHRRSVSPSSPTSASRFRWHSEAFTSPSWLPPAAPRGVGLDGPSTRPGRRRKRHSFAVEAGYTTRKGLSHAGLSHAAAAAAAAPSQPAPFHLLPPPSRPRELTPHPSSDIQDRWGDEWRARRPGWPQRGTES